MTERSPMTPENCYLAGFDYMPLEVDRLRKSRAWLIAKRRPELAFYMVNLWTASWKETPAASLEDDDDVLADAAMCPLDRWPELKQDVLRGFVRCSDGRLYHELIAVKALEAWLEKLGMRISSGHGNAKRYGATFDDSHLREQIQIARGMLFELDPDSKYFTKKAGASAAQTKKPTKRKAATSRKPAPEDDSPGALPTGADGDAGQDADGSDAGSHSSPTFSTPPSIGGKPPITPGAGAPSGGAPDGTTPAPGKPDAPLAPRGKALLKPAFELILPDWMPVDGWAKFMDMRMRMGRSIPFTEAAALGIVRKLERLRDEGHDVAEMLDASTRNGWRDVFAPKATTRQPQASKFARAAAGIFRQRNPREVVDVDAH